MKRRNFLGGIIAALCAPSTLLDVKPTIVKMRVVPNTSFEIIPARLVVLHGKRVGLIGPIIYGWSSMPKEGYP